MNLGAGPATTASPVRRELRPLGPRGEGWVGIQTVLAVILLASAVLDPWALGGTIRAIGTWLGAGLCLVGIGLFAWGAVVLGHSFSIWVTPRPDAGLVTGGPYRWTRHPICTAQAIFGFGWAALAASPVALVLAVVYAVYLDRCKLRREEETLLARYPAYASYQRQVRHRMWPTWPGGGVHRPPVVAGR